jgi:hypothetical protein
MGDKVKVKVYDDPPPGEPRGGLVASFNQKLGWTIKEYHGVEVSKSLGGPPLLAKPDLSVGDEVFVPGFSGGWYSMRVTSKINDGLFAETLVSPHHAADGHASGMGVSLKFGEDDRKCWVATCFTYHLAR